MATIRPHSVRDAADTLGVSRAHLYALIDRRQIPYADVGGVFRVNIDELAELFDRPVEGSVPSPPKRRVPGRSAPRVEQQDVDFDALLVR